MRPPRALDGSEREPAQYTATTPLEAITAVAIRAIA